MRLQFSLYNLIRHEYQIGSYGGCFFTSFDSYCVLGDGVVVERLRMTYKMQALGFMLRACVVSDGVVIKRLRFSAEGLICV